MVREGRTQAHAKAGGLTLQLETTLQVCGAPEILPSLGNKDLFGHRGGRRNARIGKAGRDSAARDGDVDAGVRWMR
jgi:hypothetical protein